MMVEDHTKANDNFKALASKKSITLPSWVTEDQRKDIDKLSKKNGKDFDKAYVDMMVKDHKDDIREFEDAETKVADNDVKNFITTTLPVLKKHLDSIQAIKSKM
jgi:putative membrane protein